MKKIAFSGLFILFWGAASYLGLPWWNTALAGLLAAWLFRLSPRSGFTIGFVAGSLLWLSAALVEHIPNGGILAARVGALFKGLKPWQLLAFTGFLGGLLGAAGGLLGGQLRDIFKKQSNFSKKN